MHAGNNAHTIKRAAYFFVCLFTCAFFAACGTSGGAGKALAAGADELSGESYTQPQTVAEPVAVAGGNAEIDTSHVVEGYVSACACNNSRLKFQVRCGEETYNYDLPNDGSSLVVPINMGNGLYTFRIMQNTSGNNYVELSAASADVVLSSEFAPYLIGNVYCAYGSSSVCVSKARDLTKSSKNVAEVVKAVCEYVAKNIKYDNAKAESLSQASGYVPNPDTTLSNGKGICFDYASLSAAMLRSVGIPTKVMTGYVGQERLYHSWIMVFINGTWHCVSFSVDPNTWSRCDVTFAATGSTEYVGDASSYEDRYTY